MTLGFTMFFIILINGCSKPSINQVIQTVSPLQGMIFQTSKRPCNGEQTCYKWWLQNIDNKSVLLTTGNSIEPVISRNLSKMVYGDKGDIWLADLNNRKKINLTNTPDCIEHYPSWSPNDEYIVFLGCNLEMPDIWVLELKSNIKRNLTNTPERFEFCDYIRLGECTVGWLPNSIIFYSWTKQDVENAPFEHSVGRLTSINLDGTSYKIWGTETASDSFSISPDMKNVAVGFGNIYNVETGQSSKFLPTDFGLNLPERAELVNPSWSPNGNMIVWQIVRISYGYDIGLAIFNFETRTSKLLISFIPYYNSPSSPNVYWSDFSVSWSPDSKRFAFSTSEQRKQGGWDDFVYIYNSNGDLEKRFNDGRSPFWDKIGEHLAFTHIGDKGLTSIYLTSIKNGELFEINAEENAILENWIQE